MKKQDPQHLSLPHVVTVDGFLVLLSSINGLPSYPIRRNCLSYSSPTQYMCLIHSANDPQDPYPTPCTLAMSGLRTPVQHPFSFVLACSSNSVPHSNKLYFLSFCLKSGNSFPTRPQTTRKVTILLDLLKSVKQSSNLSMNSYLSILFHWGSKSSFIEQNFQHY